MSHTIRTCSIVVALLVAPSSAFAQTNVVSANPFGLLLNFFNAEYERKVSDSTTAGVGGSFYRDSGDDYVNADLFYRFYPSGTPFEGFAFGVKAGITRLTEPESCRFLCERRNRAAVFGVGIDINYSWLPGETDNFYVGTGFGLKRLYGQDSYGMEYIPTIRFINVGVAF
jgi:hypothetical protein